MTDLTPNLKLELVPANTKTWADRANQNWTLIDAAVGTYFVLQNLQGVWENSHAYTAGQTVVDDESATVWTCQTDHISPGLPTTFAEARATNSTFWTVYSSPARARGAWERLTNYAVNDFVVSGSQYAVCIVSHTSSSQFATDLANGYWSVLVDLAQVGSQVLPVPGGAADADKFTVINSSGTGYTIVDKSSARAILGFTSVGNAVATATNQVEALTAIGAQPVSSALTIISGYTFGSFGITMNASTTEEAANALLGRDEADVASVAALASLTRDYGKINLLSYNAGSEDGGGGTLIHDSASSATVDNAVTFAAITGRYIRPVDGFLHTKYFGIVNSSTIDQSTKLQDFFYAISEPNNKGYQGIIDPGIINCDGASIFYHRNSGGFVRANSVCEGASRRFSILRNLLLAVGTPPWKESVASVMTMSNMRIEGYMDIWNCEVNSAFQNMYVARPTLTTFDRTTGTLYGTAVTAWTTLTAYVKGNKVTDTGVTYICLQDHTAGVFATDLAAGKWLNLTAYLNYMINIYACNHPTFINFGCDGHTGFADYKKGIAVRTTVNARFIQGVVFGCGDPATTDEAFLIDGAGSYRAYLDGVKFEQCEATQVWARGGRDHIINIWARQGTAHNLTSPLIRIGDTTLSTAYNVEVSKSRLFSDTAGSGTAIYFDRSVRSYVDRNEIIDFAVGVDMDGSTGNTSNYVGDFNDFDTTTLSVNRPATAELRQPNSVMIGPKILTDAANISWDVSEGTFAQLQITAARTLLAPTNIMVGQVYRLVLTKTNLADTLAFNSVFIFSGADPTFGAMTLTQHAVLTMECVNDPSGVVLSTSYEIRG